MSRIRPHKIIGRIFEEVRRKKWPCLHSDCNLDANNSHLGQQNGILSEIEEEGHLIQIKPSNAHHWDRKSPIEFKRLGIGQSISLPLFCNSHDTKLFKPIESTDRDITDYTSFLLFSYRTLCAEIRKKEIGCEQHRRAILSNALEGEIDKEMLKRYKLGLELGIRDLTILKNELTNELGRQKMRYKYWSIELPKYDIFVTTVMSTFPYGISDYTKNDLDNLYIHIIPQPDKSLLLIGYHEEYFTKSMEEYCLSWFDLDKKELDIKISNLITNHVENWVMSPSLFARISLKKQKEYIRLLIRDMNYFGIPNDKSFNLFETGDIV